MKIKDKRIAFGLTSSFYSFNATINEMKKIVLEGGKIIPVMSFGAYTTDTKFGKAIDFISTIEEITGERVINNMKDAEAVDTDIMVIAPCSRK